MMSNQKGKVSGKISLPGLGGKPVTRDEFKKSNVGDAVPKVNLPKTRKKRGQKPKDDSEEKNPAMTQAESVFGATDVRSKDEQSAQSRASVPKPSTSAPPVPVKVDPNVFVGKIVFDSMPAIVPWNSKADKEYQEYKDLNDLRDESSIMFDQSDSVNVEFMTRLYAVTLASAKSNPPKKSKLRPPAEGAAVMRDLVELGVIKQNDPDRLAVYSQAPAMWKLWRKVYRGEIPKSFEGFNPKEHLQKSKEEWYEKQAQKVKDDFVKQCEKIGKHLFIARDFLINRYDTTFTRLGIDMERDGVNPDPLLDSLREYIRRDEFPEAGSSETVASEEKEGEKIADEEPKDDPEDALAQFAKAHAIAKNVEKPDL